MAKIVSTGKTISTTEYLEKRNREKRKKRTALTALLFLLLVGLIFASRIQKFQIRNVIVSGAAATGADTVRDAVLKKLSGHYLWLVPHSNTLLYRKDKMKEDLSKRFPRLSRIDISLDDLNTLKVDVSERVPFALYCGQVSLITEATPCYFLDSEGFIFDTAPAFSEGVYFVYASDTPSTLPLGHHYLPPDRFMALKQLIDKLAELGIQGISLEMGKSEFRLILSTHAKVLWQITEDPSIIYSNLKDFLSTSEINSQKDFLKIISELNLLIPNQIRWKMRE